MHNIFDILLVQSSWSQKKRFDAINIVTQASSDEFSLDDVECRGNESLLTDCIHLDQVERKENCNSGEAAGVVCDPRTKDELRREADQRTEECFAKNVLFGPELNSDVWVVPTVLDCQEMCSSTEGCNTFSYDTSSMECRLHSVGEVSEAGGSGSGRPTIPPTGQKFSFLLKVYIIK